jgi:phosphate transport system substrate-binding protein
LSAHPLSAMKIPTLFVALCGALSLHAQPVLRLHGSTTVKAALEPKQAAIESEIGSRLEIQAVGSNAGILTLAGERTDVAMIASPLDEVARRLNEKKPGTIDLADYRAAEVGAVRLTFIVNPYNPVRNLSAAQLKGLLTGQVKNWQEVGGADVPVLVVSLANASTLVQEKLLQGVPIAETARRVATATQIPPVVALEPGAIGIISAAHLRGKTSLITTDAEMLVPLYLVTRGEPDPIEQKLIEAARKALRETG